MITALYKRITKLLNTVLQLGKPIFIAQILKARPISPIYGRFTR